MKKLSLRLIKNRVLNKERIEKIILWLLGTAALLICSAEKGYYFQNDSVHYLSLKNAMGVMPIYPMFIYIIKNIFNEDVYLYAVVVIQTMLAALTAIDLLYYIKKRFALERFSVYVCYFALLMLYGIDYVYAGVSHQILTEGLVYPLFYIYFKFILKSIWEDGTKYTIVHVLLACVLALTRSQMQMLLVISSVIYFYICIKKMIGFKKIKKFFVQGFIGSVTIIIVGLSIVKYVDLFGQYGINYINSFNTAAKTEAGVSSTVASNDTGTVDKSVQASNALEFKIWYLAEYEDRELFENEDVRKIYDVCFEAIEREERLYKYADGGFFKWRNMLACHGTIVVATEAFYSYAEENPGWYENLSVTFGEAKNIITKELFKTHWRGFFEISAIWAIHGLMCSVCYENDEHYALCYMIMLAAYIGAMVAMYMVARQKNTDKKTIELMAVTIVIALLLIAMVSLVLFTIKRYICYTIGIFYLAGYLLVREYVRCRFLKRTRE